MKPPSLPKCLVIIVCGILPLYGATLNDSAITTTDVQVRIEMPTNVRRDHATAAVVWLKPTGILQLIEPPAPSRFTLLQKKRTFAPHLLVIPVGSTVSFPNGDPFFHNVFSLFNGKRFDLGLYEAGSSKDVVFPREGVSYIFCNIHPEMSAVILAVSTPYFSVGDTDRLFKLRVPEGDYELHVWVEGMQQDSLERMIQKVHFAGGLPNSAVIDAKGSSELPSGHLNKFGHPYDKDPKPVY